MGGGINFCCEVQLGGHANFNLAGGAWRRDGEERTFSVDDDGKAGTFGTSQARVIFMSPGWASISASRSTLSEKLTSSKSSSTAWRKLRAAGGRTSRLLLYSSLIRPTFTFCNFLCLFSCLSCIRVRVDRKYSQINSNVKRAF